MLGQLSDTVIGVIGLAIFMVCVFVAGKILHAFQNARLGSAWSELIPVVKGQVRGDGGGAASSWLVGSYAGRSVQARMAPNSSVFSGETGVRYNHFEVAVLDVAGTHDWSLMYGKRVLGVGENGWTFRSRDSALEAALGRSPIVALVEDLGWPSHSLAVRPIVQYQRSARSLTYAEDVSPAWTPSPERFRQQLDLVLQLAAINEQINGA